MKIHAIGDLHLSFGDMVEKPMDIFGGQWIGHTEKLYNGWHHVVNQGDLVIVCGDISWGLRQEEALDDLEWVRKLPGRKVFFKGNHDLWWTSTGKLNKLYDDGSMDFVQNRCVLAGEKNEIAICGSRGWICPGTEGFTAHDRKIYERELLRLKMSLEDGKKSGAKTLIGVLHFPPTNDKMQGSGFTELFTQYGVKTCVYGHLHGKEGFKNGIKGVYNVVEYKLVSLDYLDGVPETIYEADN